MLFYFFIVFEPKKYFYIHIYTRKLNIKKKKNNFFRSGAAATFSRAREPVTL